MNTAQTGRDLFLLKYFTSFCKLCLHLIFSQLSCAKNSTTEHTQLRDQHPPGDLDPLDPREGQTIRQRAWTNHSEPYWAFVRVGVSTQHKKEEVKMNRFTKDIVI